MDTLMNAEFICLVASAVIAGIVSAFKALAIVQKYPKIVAALLSAVFGAVSGLTYLDLDWPSIAVCTLTPFLASVGVYEVAKTASNASAPKGA